MSPPPPPGLPVNPGNRLNQPPRAVAIVGFANCGKTTLICRLLGLARDQGYRVAAVKHSHKTLEVDHPGKDTWRFRQAGAQAVVLTAPGLLQVTHHLDSDPPLAAALALLPGDLDLVLVEGYKQGPLPKLAFVPPDGAVGDLPAAEPVIAYISPSPLSTGRPVFSRDQAPEILDFLLAWLEI